MPNDASGNVQPGPPETERRLPPTPARLAVAVGLSLLIALVMDRVWVLRFEINDDLAFAFMMLGRDMMPPQGDFYFFFRGGLGQLLALLHGWFGPTTYGVFILTIQFAALARWLFHLWSDCRSYWRLATVIAISLCVFANTFWLLNFTRVALLATFVGFTCLFRRPRVVTRAAWIDALLIIVGFAIRPQAGLLAMALAVLFDVIERRDLRRVGRQAIVILTIVIAFKGFDLISTSDEDREYIRRYTYGAALFDTGTKLVTPPNMLDQTRLTLAANWFFFDESAYNSQFLSRYVKLPDKIARATTLPSRLPFLWSLVKRFAGWWLWLVLLGVVVEAVVARRRGTAWMVVAQVGGAAACIILVEVLFGLKPRVLEPVAAALLLFVLAGRAKERPRRLPAAVLGIVATLLVVSQLVMAAEARAYDRVAFRHACTQTASIVDAMEQHLGDKITLVTFWSPFEMLMTHNRPLNVRFPGRTNVFTPLQGWVTQFADHRQMIDRIGSGNGVAGMFAEIEANPDRFALIAPEHLAHLFVRYSSTAYGVRLETRSVVVPGLAYFQFVSPAAGGGRGDSTVSKRPAANLGRQEINESFCRLHADRRSKRLADTDPPGRRMPPPSAGVLTRTPGGPWSRRSARLLR